MSEITSKFYKDQIMELIRIVKINQDKIRFLEERINNLELEKNINKEIYNFSDTQKKVNTNVIIDENQKMINDMIEYVLR